MSSVLDVLRRLCRREPPAPPITTLVGLTLALHSVVVALGAAMATRPADRRGGGIGVRDLDDYAVQWLVRDRLRKTRPQAATRALLGSARSPLSRRDYTVLRSPDSYHTEGFYKRESSLFHQLVGRGRRAPGRTTMPTMEEYARQPLRERVERLGRTADELATAIKNRDEATLARRPDARNFAAKECVCHLRDTEEVFMSRFEAMLAMDNPKFMPVDPATPDRWAEERQYLKNDVQQAIAHFRRRRAESLDFLRKLAPDQLRRGGVHPARGPITIDDQVTLMAWHDDNHLDQLRRALEGRA